MKNTINDKAEKLIKKIESIARNQFIIAAIMFVQGVLFLIFPSMALNGMASGVAIGAGIAALGVLIGYIKTKSFNRENAGSIVISIAVIILCIPVMIFSKMLIKPFQFLVAAALIANAAINIAELFRMDRLCHMIQKVQQKIPHSQNETVNKVVEGTAKSAEEQKHILMRSVDFVSEKSKGYWIIALMINIITAIIGILLIVFQTRTSSILVRIGGLVMILSAANDIFVAVRSLRKAESG